LKFFSESLESVVKSDITSMHYKWQESAQNVERVWKNKSNLEKPWESVIKV